MRRAVSTWKSKKWLTMLILICLLRKDIQLFTDNSIPFWRTCCRLQTRVSHISRLSKSRKTNWVFYPKWFWRDVYYIQMVVCAINPLLYNHSITSTTLTRFTSLYFWRVGATIRAPERDWGWCSKENVWKFFKKIALSNMIKHLETVLDMVKGNVIHSNEFTLLDFDPFTHDM